MNKEKIISDLIEARGLREYWRIKYNNAWFFDSYEEAMYEKWDSVVYSLECLLENEYGITL